jgi:hypothetical protein
VNRALRSAGGTDVASIERQVQLANEIARAVEALAPTMGDDDDLVAPTNDVLMALATPDKLPAGSARFPDRPEVPLSSSALLVNARDQPRIGTEVQRELASADQVDLSSVPS